MDHLDLIAGMFANADHEQQAEILNRFVTHLTVLCKHGRGSVSNAHYYIGKALNGETATFLQEVVDSFRYLTAEADRRKVEIDDKWKRLSELDEQIRQREQALEAI